MDRPQVVNRRQALGLLAGGGAGAAALKMLPDPLEAAQVATRRGLPRLKITEIKVILTQVGNTHMTNAKVLTSEPGLYGVGCGGHAERQSIVAQTIEQYLKPAAIGRYVDEIEDIWQMAWLAPYWRGSVDANNAMSAIDGALWEACGHAGPQLVRRQVASRPPDVCQCEWHRPSAARREFASAHRGRL
jgi:mannonate dehydratase